MTPIGAGGLSRCSDLEITPIWMLVGFLHQLGSWLGFYPSRDSDSYLDCIPRWILEFGLNRPDRDPNRDLHPTPDKNQTGIPTAAKIPTWFLLL